MIEKRIIESGGKCLFSYLDVTSEKSWEKAINDTVEKFGGLDILVNNAGVSGRGLIEDTTEEEWDRVMNTNTKGSFLGIKAALPSLKKSVGASIINISSVAGLIGSRYTAYGASKGAVRLLTKSTAIEYGPVGIRCNSVHPGIIATDMTK